MASKLQRSLAAHKRLSIKHSQKSSERSRRLSSYHHYVHDKQWAKGKVLSRDERRRIYISYGLK